MTPEFEKSSVLHGSLGFESVKSRVKVPRWPSDQSGVLMQRLKALGSLDHILPDDTPMEVVIFSLVFEVEQIWSRCGVLQRQNQSSLHRPAPKRSNLNLTKQALPPTTQSNLYCGKAERPTWNPISSMTIRG